MLRAAPIAIVLLVAACGPVQPPPDELATAGTAILRVATWNVHDLFDAEDRLDAPGALDDVPAEAEVEAKIASVAAVLVRVDADVVVLQEVETLALAEALATRAGYAEARLVEGNDPRGIDVAALSRVRVAAYVSHASETGPDGAPLWPRDCVELHVRASGRRVAVVASHLSSALSDDGTRRAQQAARMREIADGLSAADPGALVLVAGDLNDASGAPALAPLLGDGAWRDALPPDAWTWSSGSRRAHLDYVLVPRASAPSLLDAGVVAGEDVAVASDHLPVIADVFL
jgi:endonuclease/exonuclease/phosphatase family metal-dependent hydrolase